MKYSREKTLYSRNTHEKKFRTYEIPTRKKFGQTKYSQDTKYPREYILNPRNTHEKIFWAHEIPEKTFWTQTYRRWHVGTKPTRPTMERDTRNFAHSKNSWKYKKKLALIISD